MASRASPQELKLKFKALDANGDNCLDFAEFCVLLKKGNPSFGESALKALFKRADKSGDGVLQFDEFIDYLYGNPDAPDARTGHARRASLRAQNATDDHGDERLWAECARVFEAFVGEDCDGKEFVKLCKDCHFTCKKFSATSCDIVFAGAVTKGQRRMDFEQFKLSCGKIAKQKGITVAELQQKMLEAGGPQFVGTKADTVRLHDDKTTYTGAHVFNENHGEGDAVCRVGSRERDADARHRRISVANEVLDFGDDGMWHQCAEIFDAFVGKDCDGKEFVKICTDCSLFAKNFNVTDCDIVFSGSVAKGQRRMGFHQFKIACGKIAAKKGCSVQEIQERIICTGGPHYAGTKAEAVRFHDDKDSYTGLHAQNENHNGAGGVERTSDARHIRLHQAAKVHDFGDAAMWDTCHDVFTQFVGADCDGKEFVKLCRDCGVLNGRFTVADADLVFSACVVKGQRRMGFEQFQVACGKIAAKADRAVQEIQEGIIAAGGPKYAGTKAESVRFHDDKSTYTGTHFGK